MKTLEHMQRARELLSRGQEELAESALSDAIDDAVAAENLVLLTQARMALGELMVEQGRLEEALPFLLGRCSHGDCGWFRRPRG